MFQAVHMHFLTLTLDEGECSDWTAGLVFRLDSRLSVQTVQQAEWTDWTGG